MIRWPGGCYADTYHWRNGIGPRESRPVTYNENFGTYETDSNQFGTHEFMELWGIGNEVWAGGGTMTPQSYAGEYRKYASSFPNFVSLENGGKPRTEMKRIASGPDRNKPKERVEWTKQFFAELGKFRRPQIDGYDLHFYNWNLDKLDQRETEFDEEEWNKVIHNCFELEEVIQEQLFPTVLRCISSVR